MRILNETIPSKHQGGVTLRLDRGHSGDGGEVHYIIRYFMRFPFDIETLKLTSPEPLSTLLDVWNSNDVICVWSLGRHASPALSLVSSLISHDHSTLHSTTLSLLLSLVINSNNTLKIFAVATVHLSGLETCVCSCPCLCSWQGFNHFAVAQNSADSQKPLSTKHKRTAGKLEGLTSRLTHWF